MIGPVNRPQAGGAGDGVNQPPLVARAAPAPINADIFAAAEVIKLGGNDLQEIRVAITADNKIAIQTTILDPSTQQPSSVSTRIFNVRKGNESIQHNPTLRNAQEKVKDLFRDESFANKWLESATRAKKSTVSLKLRETEGSLVTHVKGKEVVVTARYTTDAAIAKVAIQTIPTQGVPRANPGPAEQQFPPEPPAAHDPVQLVQQPRVPQAPAAPQDVPQMAAAPAPLQPTLSFTAADLQGEIAKRQNRAAAQPAPLPPAAPLLDLAEAVDVIPGAAEEADSAAVAGDEQGLPAAVEQPHAGAEREAGAPIGGELPPPPPEMPAEAQQPLPPLAPPPPPEKEPVKARLPLPPLPASASKAKHPPLPALPGSPREGPLLKEPLQISKRAKKLVEDIQKNRQSLQEHTKAGAATSAFKPGSPMEMLAKGRAKEAESDDEEAFDFERDIAEQGSIMPKPADLSKYPSMIDDASIGKEAAVQETEFFSDFGDLGMGLAKKTEKPAVSKTPVVSVYERVERFEKLVEENSLKNACGLLTQMSPHERAALYESVGEEKLLSFFTALLKGGSVDSIVTLALAYEALNKSGAFINKFIPSDEEDREELLDSLDEGKDLQGILGLLATDRTQAFARLDELANRVPLEGTLQFIAHAEKNKNVRNAIAEYRKPHDASSAAGG